MFVFREEYYLTRAEPAATENRGRRQVPGTLRRLEERCEEVYGMAEVIVAKQRHGPIGTSAS